MMKASAATTAAEAPLCRVPATVAEAGVSRLRASAETCRREATVPRPGAAVGTKLALTGSGMLRTWVFSGLCALSGPRTP